MKMKKQKEGLGLHIHIYTYTHTKNVFNIDTYQDMEKKSPSHVKNIKTSLDPDW